MFKLTVGDDEAWTEIQYKCETWYEFLSEPTVKPFDLGQFATSCIKKMGMKNHLKQLDRMILALIEFDLFQVVKEIQNMADNGWFVCHLTDLLFHADNERKTQKIIYEAKKRNISHIAQSVSKTQGIISMKHGRLGNALMWALRSQDGPFTSYLADMFLQDYIKSGKLLHTDLLEDLGSWILASDRLIFLGKFYEFHKLYQNGEYRQAASILLSLMVSKIVPKYFWCVLLLETLPLLESEEIVFSSSDTYTILHCLDDKEDFSELKDKIDIIRFAAARNLARALIYEEELP
ncbi:hypothetical protein NQ317_012820 [Molorchus minor]|uniref:Nuclear pore complex protein Nup85 n=1 Tax=Molorchus minor TaxID=1323400 RepID=A0ABQ9K421_9CUCU|nr:hypothetical protein NQ317_012820 [Molorchus minor]